MHGITPAVSLLRGVWGIDHEGLALKIRWQWGVFIPSAEVVVEVRYCMWYYHPETIVVVVLIALCYKSCVMLRVVDLHNSDAILEWVLQTFLC